MKTKSELISLKLKEEISLLLKSHAFALPPERVLAEEYNVSRYTIRHAISTLVCEGYLKQIQGSGNILTGKDPLSDKKTLALILNTDSEYIYPSFISILEREFKKYNIDLDVLVTNHDYSIERNFLLELKDSNYLGVIIEPCYSAYLTPNADLFDKLYAENFPVLFISGLYPNIKSFPVIKDDDISGGYAAGEYLNQNSHKHISVILQSDTISGQEKLTGLYNFLNDNDMELDNNCIQFFLTNDLIALQKKQNTSFLVEYIDKHIDGCSAIICQNDEIAYYLIKELTIRGISVPSDISIISFDGSYMSDISRIPITSFSHGENEKAVQTVNSFMDILKGKRNIYITLPWFIEEKSSSDSIG